MEEKTNAKKERAVGTVLFMMAATLLSKLLGMLRGILFAAVFETSLEANAFTVAQHIPLTCFDLLFSSAILGCFIPEYAGFFGRGKAERDEGDRYACIFLNTVVLLCSLLALVGMLAAGPLVRFTAPGLDAETAALAVRLLRILFPMIVFTGAAYTLVGVMQTRGRYFLPAMISAISNAGVIVYLVLFAPRLGEKSVWGLAVAYLCAWLLQFLTLAVPLRISGFRFRLLLDFRDPTLRATLKKLPPVIAGSWLMPVTVYSGIFFSSFLTEAVSVFDYAHNIHVILAGTLTYSLCNYLFPKLARLKSSGQGGFAETTADSLRIALTIILPFVAAVLVLYREGTAILYLRRNFRAEAADLTAGLLRYMALGMPFFAVNELLSRAFYAEKKTLPPMLAAVAGIAANLALSALLVLLKGREAHLGLAYALGQAVSALTLFFCFARENRGVAGPALGRPLLWTVACSLLSLGAMGTVYRLYGNLPYEAGMLRNLLCCALVFLPGAAVYLAGLLLGRRLFRRDSVSER